MKRFLLSVSCAFAGIYSLPAQILFQENFEADSLPAGWSVETQATDGGWNVGTPTALSSQYFTIAGNGSLRVAGTNDD
ncbi:MAG TPA: hypothetical protein PK228_22460, partial [Saprospiraceae bacterium]|nr:hypothetical protein [Saprospiraceae bacterium]